MPNVNGEDGAGTAREGVLRHVECEEAKRNTFRMDWVFPRLK